MQTSKIVLNEVKKQFEMKVNEDMAFTEYTTTGDKMYITHSEVPKQLEGQGIGSSMVEQVLQYIKDNNLKVVPLCPFVAAYINKHNKWQSILSDGYKM